MDYDDLCTTSKLYEPDVGIADNTGVTTLKLPKCTTPGDIYSSFVA